MTSLLRNLSIYGLAAGLAMVASEMIAADTTLQGVLMDKQCSAKAEPRVVPGPSLDGGIVVAYAHTRQCALMPDCQKSGYGVFTYDQKFVAFDEAGNRKALALLKESKKEDDLRVEVAGQTQGDIFKVTSIKLMP